MRTCPVAVEVKLISHIDLAKEPNYPMLKRGRDNRYQVLFRKYVGNYPAATVLMLGNNKLDWEFSVFTDSVARGSKSSCIVLLSSLLPLRHAEGLLHIIPTHFICQLSTVGRTK
jgi:hypothetical protein